MKPTGYTEMDPRFEPEDPVRWSNWVTEVRGATHRHDRLCGPAVQGLGSALRDGDMGSTSTGLGLLEQARTQHEPSKLTLDTGLNDPLTLV